MPGVGAADVLAAGAAAEDEPLAADLAAGAFDFFAAGADEPPVAGAGAAVASAGAASVPASVAGASSVGVAAGVSGGVAPVSGATVCVSAGFGAAELSLS